MPADIIYSCLSFLFLHSACLTLFSALLDKVKIIESLLNQWRLLIGWRKR